MGEWSIAVAAMLVVAFAAGSRRLEGLGVTAPLFFVTTGLLAGVEVLDWIHLSLETSGVRLLAEGALALVLFADASRIDLRALRREYGLPVRLLGIGLPLTIVAGASLAVGLLPRLSWSEAFVLAVVLAPTDAALGQAVVTDRRLPSRVRQGLNVESGLNDGICVPLLLVALASTEAETGVMSGRAALRLLLEKLGYGLVAGAVAGALCAVLLGAAHRRALAEPGWLQILPAGGAALAYAGGEALGGSGFIAAFAAGLLFGVLSERRHADTGTDFVDRAGELLTGWTFIVFGAGVAGPLLAKIDWRVALYAVLSLTAVRMLPVAAALIGTGARRPTVAYLGWFGPRGLATIVFAGTLVDESSPPHTETILAVAAAVVVFSVYAHGLSAGPLTERYVAWYRSHPRDSRPSMESLRVAEHRWRRHPAPV
jgi:NhaP-type Na+/H+ or K+/H+ antiporter